MDRIEVDKRNQVSKRYALFFFSRALAADLINNFLLVIR